MSKYIDADLHVEMQIYDDEHEEWSLWNGTIEELLDQWTEQGCPLTIDIVHCEECKHFNVDDYECENSEVAFDMSGGGDCSASRCRTDFCSAGERKDNE